jgi:hypothetical protein
MTSLPLHRDIPNDYVKNGGGMWPKCGTKGGTYGGAACQNPGFRMCEGDLMRPGYALSTPGNFKPLKRLTVWRAEDYIGPLGRAAAWRDCASAKPLTVYTVNHPAMTYGHVGCAGIGGSGSCRDAEMTTEPSGSGLFDK